MPVLKILGACIRSSTMAAYRKLEVTLTELCFSSTLRAELFKTVPFLDQSVGTAVIYRL